MRALKSVAFAIATLSHFCDAYRSAPQPLAYMDGRNTILRMPTFRHAAALNDGNEKINDANDAMLKDNAGTTPYKPLTVTQKAAQPIQLAVTIWLLLLLPAGIFSPQMRSLCGVRALGIIPYQYLLLFGLGTLPRQWRFGRYSKVVQPKEGKRGTSTRDFVLFQLCLFACHWVAARAFVTKLGISNGSRLPLYVLRGLDALRWVAILLNCSSAWILGRAYDRVTKPEALITSGPYSIVRHPIYTSYLLLFGSTMLTLGSFSAFAGLVVGSLLFYSGRMKAEDDILKDAFQEAWDEYAKQVPYRLFPGLL